MIEFDVAAARRVGERWGASEDFVGCSTAGCLLLQACAEIERLRAERQWIPVEERLPEDGIKVLVCFKGEIDSIEIREFLGGLGGVTHWMPLPEPPEVK